MRDDVAEVVSGDRERTQRVPQLGHHGGGLQRVAEDVADGEQGAVVVEFEDVVEVATDLDRLTRREIAHRDLEIGRLRGSRAAASPAAA